MYFFLILFSYMAVAGLFGDWNPFSRNSRFDKFNSRSVRRKFPVRAITGIWSQGLDSVLPFSLPNGCWEGENRRNSRFSGKSGNHGFMSDPLI
jgi:hypothetical protein